ncbi:MAG TPA: V4R domain-containing protein [Nitrososphaerales archaeon]|nr:V4R domain-containing protein [Nitrososphaerales archaeon]
MASKPDGIQGLAVDAASGLPQDPFLGTRVLAIDPDFYKGLRKRLGEVFQTGATTILYEIGVGYGEQMGKVIEEEGKGKLSTYRDFIEKGRYQGWGRFETPIIRMIVAGLKGEMVVKLERSFFAEAVGKTGEAECYIVAGMVKGAAKVILGKEMDCIEEKCASKGDEFCQFRLVPDRKGLSASVVSNVAAP